MDMAMEMTIAITDEGGLRMLPGMEPQPVRQWETGTDGKRRPGAAQAVSPDGVPLWDLRVFASTVVFDRLEPAFVTLRIASSTAPVVDDLTMLPLLIGGAA